MIDYEKAILIIMINNIESFDSTCLKKEYFLNNVKPKVEAGDEVLWIKYELADPRYTDKMRQIATQASHLAQRIVSGENVVKLIDEFLNLC